MKNGRKYYAALTVLTGMFIMSNADKNGQALAVQRQADSGVIVSKKAGGIKIPEIDFRDATVKDVVEFLRDASREFDTSDDRVRGVNILIVPESESNRVSFLEKKITFQARYISLYNAIRYVALLLDVPFYCDAEAVMLGRENKEQILMMYDVLPTAFSGLPKTTGGSIDSGQLKRFFHDAGVDFPEGAAIQYLPEIGRVSVRNTRRNLAVFETVLDYMNVIPVQIEVTLRAREIIDPQILVSTNDDSVLRNDEVLVSSGKIRPLLDMNVIAQVPLSASNSVTEKDGSASFEISPLISPEGQLITLAIQGRMTLPGTIDEKDTVRYTFNTTMSIYHGATMRLWLNTPATDRKGNLNLRKRYLAISVNLIDPVHRVLKRGRDRPIFVEH